jgi:hypothetical protein
LRRLEVRTPILLTTPHPVYLLRRVDEEKEKSKCSRHLRGDFEGKFLHAFEEFLQRKRVLRFPASLVTRLAKTLYGIKYLLTF